MCSKRCANPVAGARSIRRDTRSTGARLVWVILGQNHPQTIRQREHLILELRWTNAAREKRGPAPTASTTTAASNGAGTGEREPHRDLRWTAMHSWLGFNRRPRLAVGARSAPEIRSTSEGSADYRGGPFAVEQCRRSGHNGETVNLRPDFIERPGHLHRVRRRQGREADLQVRRPSARYLNRKRLNQLVVRIRPDGVDTPFGSEELDGGPASTQTAPASPRAPVCASRPALPSLETAHRPFRHDGDPSDTGIVPPGAGVDLPFVVDERRCTTRARRRASSVPARRTTGSAAPRACSVRSIRFSRSLRCRDS